ncbi:NapH/MauN family ferredoxin-type protein [Adlercreutzia faecimuris]|uniref:NapH/MauN family ferredoxin-type protein n=1 Tax=Adlercreutzia faecimuris TaxID=2897341 RepID=A0ABS9WH14_9ACTN|nr:NapH/MauN family ferredoxin-type protein [Adlercreutzia sp. JBNU-10]MCI2241546.1 NapH/MauN family ferredoxin-type protein [Adlercreutzia sp. JBNU-10]
MVRGTRPRRGIGRVTAVRRVVQCAALVLFCLPLVAAGWGLAGGFAGGDAAVPTPAEGVFYGSLASSSVGGVTLLDPLAALQVAAASRELAPALLVGVLPVVAAYGLIRGRAFCGWVCPVNLLGEAADWLRARLGIEVRERAVPRHAKLGVAAGVVALSAVAGVPVFESFNPVGAVNRGLLFGALAGVWTLAAVLACDVLWGRRVWCRALCPMGGVYEALGRMGQVNVAIDHDACTRCGRCEAVCPADPAILAPAVDGADAIVRAGDCMACGACVDACPADALRFRLGRPRRPAAAGAPSPAAADAAPPAPAGAGTE